MRRRRPAVGVLPLLRLLVAAGTLAGAVAAAQVIPIDTDPPPAEGTGAAAATPEETLAARQAEIGAALKAAHARLEALPAEAVEARRADAEREVDLLQRIDRLLGLRVSLGEALTELEVVQGKLDDDLKQMRLSGPVEPPPYTLVELDQVRDERDAEAVRGEALAAGVEAATTALAQARRTADERATARRRAKEALDTNDDADATDRLARGLEFARLESTAATETVTVRELELQRETLALAVHELRLAFLDERLRRMQAALGTSTEDLKAKLVELRGRESDLQERLRLAETNRDVFEPEWLAAKRRLASAADPAPALAAEVEAWKFAYQARQREIAAIKKKIERVSEARTIWTRRFELLGGDVDRATLRTWNDETSGHLEALDSERQLLAAQLAALRQQVSGVETRLEAARGDAPEVERWLQDQSRHLRDIVKILEAEIAGIEATQRLHRRLSDEIGVEQEHVSLRERLSAVWASVLSVWNFEITSVEETPITVGKVVVGLLILLFGLVASRWLSRFLGRRLLPRLRLDEGAVAAAQTLLFYLLVVTFTLYAFRYLRVPLTAFTVLGGALAIGVGFGSQNIINNFISGLIMLAERPVRVGDLIQLGDIHGTVEHIGARSTRVRTGANFEIIVPNSTFLEQDVVNWTLTEDRIRATVTVGVAYGSPTREVQKIIRRAVEDHGRVLKAPAPVVLFTDFGDNALAFEVHFWIRMRTMMERHVIESDVRHHIDRLFRDAGIVIAFPQRDVHLDAAQPLEVRVLAPPASGDEDAYADGARR